MSNIMTIGFSMHKLDVTVMSLSSYLRSYTSSPLIAVSSIASKITLQDLVQLVIKYRDSIYAINW
jgi:hypothetical protein